MVKRIVVADDSWWVRAGNVGRIFGPIYLIRAKYADDPGWNAHEQHHCRSCLRLGILPYYLAYAVSRRFRLREEAAAYRAQWRANGCRASDLGTYTRLLAGPVYNLDIDSAQALQAILEAH